MRGGARVRERQRAITPTTREGWKERGGSGPDGGEARRGDGASPADAPRPRRPNAPPRRRAQRPLHRPPHVHRRPFRRAMAAVGAPPYLRGRSVGGAPPPAAVAFTAGVQPLLLFLSTFPHPPSLRVRTRHTEPQRSSGGDVPLLPEAIDPPNSLAPVLRPGTRTLECTVPRGCCSVDGGGGGGTWRSRSPLPWQPRSSLHIWAPCHPAEKLEGEVGGEGGTASDAGHAAIAGRRAGSRGTTTTAKWGRAD